MTIFSDGGLLADSLEDSVGGNIQIHVDHKKVKLVSSPVDISPNTIKFQVMEPVKTSQHPINSGSIRFTADKIVEGMGDQEAVIEGNVIVEYEDQILNTDRIIYKNNMLFAHQPFKLQNKDNILSGTSLEYDLNNQLGTILNFQFNSRARKIPLQGEGKKLTMMQKNFYSLHKARVNTCDPGDDSWYIAAQEIKMDYDKNVGIARNAQFIFLGVPIAIVPWLDFPLNGHRKSGFLSPIIRIKSGNGLEFALPYYFNLAPNYDMTIAPHVYSKRGIGADGEFRYLLPDFLGHVAGSFVLHDKIAKKELQHNNRYVVSLDHRQKITPNLSLGIDYNQVSDNYYFKDFGTRTASAENNNLNRQLWLSYNDYVLGGPFSAFFTIQHYQTLQNYERTINEPYRLQPQLILHWSKFTQGTVDFDVLAQLSNFDHRTKPTGIRGVLYPRIVWNISNAWGFFRPGFGLHATHYQLDNYNKTHKDGTKINLPRRSFSRVLPIFSVDTGLILEKSLKFNSRNFIQTLEPRLFYVYIPNKEQEQLPNFDSQTVDMIFDNLFRVNRFTGHDRINQSNNLSYGLVTKFYNQINGFELFRAGLGQRFYLNKDKISSTNKIHGNRKNNSDILLFARGQITDSTSLRTDVYFNRNRKTDSRYTLGLRYNPDVGKVFNLNYKYDKNSFGINRTNKKFQQIDFSFQWPMANRYSLVGRYNYSLSDKKLLEGLAGVEYISKCRCWRFNVAYQTYMIEQHKRKNAVFFQLNFKGLGGLGPPIK